MLPARTKAIPKLTQITKQTGNHTTYVRKMSSLFYPHRHHQRSRGNLHYLTPYTYQSNPSVYREQDPFGLSLSFDQPFHRPFLSLFNDTFSQLDRLSSELNAQINDGGSNFDKMLTMAPKFDVKETESDFVLEGELPGVEKKDISLDFVDDNTLVLQARTERVRQEGNLSPDSGDRVGEKRTVETSKDDAEHANGAHAQDESKDKNRENVSTVATTDKNKEVSQPTPKTQYHITERSVGTFRRVFTIPGEIKHAEVRASLKNGVLTVKVPKAIRDAKEEKQNRSVSIEDVPAEEEGEKVKL